MSVPVPKPVLVPQGQPFRGSAQDFSPPWLRGYVGSRYIFADAIQWDTLAEMCRIGVLQRFPTKAQSSALVPLGVDRKIWRGVAETDAHYAERLRRFKSTWRLAGNAPTLLRQLWEYMTPNATRIRYVVNGYGGTVADAGSQFSDWWTIDDTGLVFERTGPCNWDWDGVYSKNIRFWIIVYRSDIITPYWGLPDGGYDWGTDDLYWGAAPGSDRTWVIDTFNIVRAFKAAGSHMGTFPIYDGGLIIADPTFTSAPWGPEGPFPPSAAPGYPMPDGTFADPTARPPGATYIQGL